MKSPPCLKQVCFFLFVAFADKHIKSCRHRRCCGTRSFQVQTQTGILYSLCSSWSEASDCNFVLLEVREILDQRLDSRRTEKYQMS